VKPNPAVVLMAYGSPDRLSDVPAYYADIRGGRPVRPELVDALVERYRTLGLDEGRSPLNEITEQTRAALEAQLGIPVRTGMRHWEPRIAQAVDELLAEGHDHLVGLVLAPHWSSLSIAKYQTQFDEAIDGRVSSDFKLEWAHAGGFAPFLAKRCRALLDERDAHVIFTAHSLPARILDTDDSYPESLLRTARAVAAAATIGDRWSFSFQSESPTGEAWLGPDILEHLAELRERGVDEVLVCPIGFVSDHLEIRWDIDVEAAERARELGLGLRRIEMPNADPAFVEVLAGVVRGELWTNGGTP
jgi:protoporphyrin/coproporphyrin ferrochelatase